MHKIASKIAKKLRKQKAQKVIDLQSRLQSKAEADQAWAKVKSVDTLIEDGYNEMHAYYTHVQNFLSLISEAFIEMDEMSRFHTIMAESEDVYMPSAPPHSPITNSYYFCWAHFDLAIGIQKETILSICNQLQSLIKTPKHVHIALLQFEQSRMGIYEHMGIAEGNILLREINTDKTLTVHNPTDYKGKKHELWFTRLLPMDQQGECWLSFNTPYVLTAGLDDWQSYLNRGTWRGNKAKKTYEQLMIEGPTRYYWLEYIMQAYQGTSPCSGAIFLGGIPDIGSSRPHYSKAHASHLPERTSMRLLTK